MIYQWILAFFITIAIACPSYAFETKAPYAIMIDAQTGSTIFEKQAGTPITPSSMSKLMTIYVVFDMLKQKQLALNDTFMVSEKAWSKKGSKMFINLNEHVTVENLLRGAIVQSGNDACIALAEGVAGSEDAFVDLMNLKAKQLNLTDSHFVNATGWPDPGHVMSLRDLSTISRRLLFDFPEYYHYFGEKEFSYANIRQTNRNLLLWRNMGVDGLKTGSTDHAGLGLVASASQHGRRLIVVVNGLKSEKSRANEVERLLRYGFFNFVNKTLFKPGDSVTQPVIIDGKSPHITLTVAEEITLSLPKHNAEDILEINYHIPPIHAPIQQGTELGNVEIKNRQTQEARIFPLFAAEDVRELSFVTKIFRSALRMVGL